MFRIPIDLRRRTGFLAGTALYWLTGTPQRFDGVPLAGRHCFGTVPDRGGVVAMYGDTVLEIARRGGHDILRPPPPDNPLRARFRGTPADDPHSRWLVPGRYVPYDGLLHVNDAAGRVEFEPDG